MNGGASHRPVIEAMAVSHLYGKRRALRQVDLVIPSGCMFGLIGPDGVGKSTLLGLIAGARKLQNGALRVLDGDIDDRSHRGRCQRRIAYMPQGLGRNLYPDLTVSEHVDFFASLWSLDRRERAWRGRELLGATGLLPFADRAMGQLSGGMKQKLGLCCALVHDPDLLVLDEPTTGIDPLSRRQFWELIGNLRRRRPEMTVLASTSYMREAHAFDRLAAMSAGSIIASGTPAEILARTDTDDLDRAFVRLMGEDSERIFVPSRPPAPDIGTLAIEAYGLSKSFNHFVAVDHVDLRIQKGEIFGFIGSNGCGKTTTIKMLTGLLKPTSGMARVFGITPDASDLATRRRVGYMSQAFSLYDELSVRQNLLLHARLYQVPADRRRVRVEEMLRRFGLEEYSQNDPRALPLGVRQRLSLAVALIHEPDLLILDEPTSGVDPLARDLFWRHLTDLSRNDQVTIFVSTHFMDEAERCDRISLMHAGRILATGSPKDLVHSSKKSSLEEFFVAKLESLETKVGMSMDWNPSRATGGAAASANGLQGAAARIVAYAEREARELSRDVIRLSFALLGPLLLMFTFGFGISFDVEDLPFAVLDLDRSLESREFFEPLRGSRYFVERPEIADTMDAHRRMQGGDIVLSVEIPSGFGRDLLAGRPTEVSIWLDGSMPYRAETARGYLEGVVALAARDMAQGIGLAREVNAPFDIEPRFRYNQSFESVVAIVPGIIMLLLILIPAMMTALGVVREKEIGTIVNFYTTPVTRLEFLIAKQLPYSAVAIVSFVSLWLMARWIFGIEMRGSSAAFTIGAVLFVFSATGFGLLISSFVRSQMAAIFATAIIAMIPTVSFSGFLDPTSSLNEAGRWFGRLFPASYFQHISVGAMVKGLDSASLWPDFLALAGFAAAFLLVSMLFLRKQER